MLEEKIVALTKALEANTAALALASGGAGAAAAAPTKGPGRPKKEEAKTAAPEHSAEEVKAIIVKVKEDVDTPTAQKIIKDAGAKDLATLLTMPAAFDAAFAAAEAALEAADGGDDDGL